MIALALKTQEAQAEHGKRWRFALGYKRRYWDIETQAFVLEGSETELSRDEVAAIGTMRDQLDKAQLNEYKTSNLVIELDNRDNQWGQWNPSGLLAKDATARKGYKRRLMQFHIESFYLHDDGTESAGISYFLGYATRWEPVPGTKTVRVTLESRSIFLNLSDAESVSHDSAVDEALVGTVDGINTIFYSANNGVGRVTNVRVRAGAFESRIGIDVEIADTDQWNAPAKFTFAVAPSVVTADAPVATYTYWYQDQKIEALVKLLGVEGGIPLLEQDVDDVVFQNQVINTRLWTLQVDFEGGLTVQNLDTTTTAGQFTRRWFLFDDFTDGDISDWTIAYLSPSIVDVVSGRLHLYAGRVATGATAYKALTKAYGSWTFDMESSGGTSDVARIFFMVSNIGSNNGYAIRYAYFSNTAYLVRQSAGVETDLLSLGSIPAGSVKWRISRNASGLFTVYKDGTSLGTYTDNTHTTSAYFYAVVTMGPTDGSTPHTVYLDNIYWGPGLDNGTSTITDTASIFETQAIDGTIDIEEYLQVIVSHSLASGTSLTIETATSADGITWDAYVAVGSAGQILSTQRRYIKVRVTLNVAALPTGNTPTVTDVRLVFTSATTTIKLANFRDMNCFDAISELAAIANYEWGISRDGRLFFRARSFDTTPDYEITLKNLEDFAQEYDGEDRVYNIIKARYGDYEKIVTPETQGDARPHSWDEYGKRTLNIGSSQILINPDADIATGLARAYFQLYKTERPRYDIAIDYAPQLELGDTIRLRVLDNTPNPPWYIGDSSRAIGDTDIRLYGEDQQSAHEIIARVLSLRHDKTTCSTGLELEKILT